MDATRRPLAFAAGPLILADFVDLRALAIPVIIFGAVRAMALSHVVAPCVYTVARQ